LVLFIVLVALAFKIGTFNLNFWGDPKLGSVLDQVKSTMLVTVWVFIGIEGASVYSARARKREDVGRATVIGFVITLVLLMAVSLLSLGILSQPALAEIKNPSMAGVLEQAVGTWGAILIYIGLIVSVGGGFLTWMLLAAESLFTPADGGVMPAWLAKQNDKGVPANALLLTNGMVQVFLVITLFSKASYLALISLSTAMILVPYLFSALYGLSLAWRGQGEQIASKIKFGGGATLIAAIAAIYCLWLFYAAGLKYLLLSALLYAPGAIVYVVAKRQRAKRVFNTWEWAILAVLVVMALVSVYLLVTGQLGL
jgi:arginine:ornithine antiporter/lysine permease